MASVTGVPFQVAGDSGATEVEPKADVVLDVTPRINEDVDVSPERLAATMRNTSQAWLGDVDADLVATGIVLETVVRIDPDGGTVIDLRQRLEYSDVIDALADQLDYAESLNGAFLQMLLEIREDEEVGFEIRRGPTGIPIFDMDWRF